MYPKVQLELHLCSCISSNKDYRATKVVLVIVLIDKSNTADGESVDIII